MSTTFLDVWPIIWNHWWMEDRQLQKRYESRRFLQTCLCQFFECEPFLLHMAVRYFLQVQSLQSYLTTFFDESIFTHQHPLDRKVKIWKKLARFCETIVTKSSYSIKKKKMDRRFRCLRNCKQISPHTSDDHWTLFFFTSSIVLPSHDHVEDEVEVEEKENQQFLRWEALIG